MNHFQSYAIGSTNELICEGATENVDHFMINLVKKIVSAAQAPSGVIVLCDEKAAFMLRHYQIGEQHHISIKHMAAPACENERAEKLAALYRSAEEANLRGSYVLSNKLLNDATALVNTPVVHQEAKAMAKQATRLIAHGVEAVCNMKANMHSSADLLAMEQVEVMATLANIEGDMIALYHLHNLGLFGETFEGKVILLGTQVANLVIGTPYRHTPIASEVITTGERLFGALWVDALLRA